MPKYYVETVDGTFRARDDGADYTDIQNARQAAVGAAVAIASGEVTAGHQSSSVKASIHDENGKLLAKFAVALCVTELHLLTPDITTGDSQVGLGRVMP